MLFLDIKLEKIIENNNTTNGEIFVNVKIKYTSKRYINVKKILLIQIISSHLTLQIQLCHNFFLNICIN
jgi:hypothetical protein